MDQAGWTVYQQSAGVTGEIYRTFRTRAEAIAARVEILNDWRESGSKGGTVKSSRTATKHFVPGRAGTWTECDGHDLKERGFFGVQIIGFVNLFPARDR